MDEDKVGAVLAEAFAGRRLSRRTARQLASTLRRVTDALAPGTGNLSGLSRDLKAAADALDVKPQRLHGVGGPEVRVDATV
jgi:ABC-type transporter Mla subunit MlaD